MELTDPASYKILEEIGMGATSVVYKAQCIPLDKIVAIKVIPFIERPEYIKLYICRAECHRSLMNCDEKRILKFICIFRVGTCIWIIMPFLDGGSLLSLMEDSGLPEAMLTPILKRVLQNLCYLSESFSVLNPPLDLKASNILLDSEGNVVLADLGISASYLAELDLGAPPYWEATNEIKNMRKVSNGFLMWSFGVLSLELARGCPAIGLLNLSKNFMKMVCCRFGLRDRYHKHFMGLDCSPSGFTSNFKNMIKLCFSTNVNDRTSPAELLCHPLFTDCLASNSVIKNLIESRTKQVPVYDDLKLKSWKFDESLLQLLPIYEEYKRGRIDTFLKQPNPIIHSVTLKKLQKLHMDCIKESTLRTKYLEQELGKINLTISSKEAGEAEPINIQRRKLNLEELELSRELKATGEAGPSNTQAAAETSSLDELARTASFPDAGLTQTAETSAVEASFLHAGPSFLDAAAETSFLDAGLTQKAETSALSWTAAGASFPDAGLTQTAETSAVEASFLHAGPSFLDAAAETETSALSWTAAEAMFPDAGPSLLDDAPATERIFLDELAAELEAGTFDFSSFLND